MYDYDVIIKNFNRKNKVCKALLKLWLIYGWKKSYLEEA